MQDKTRERQGCVLKEKVFALCAPIARKRRRRRRVGVGGGAICDSDKSVLQNALVSFGCSSPQRSLFLLLSIRKSRKVMNHVIGDNENCNIAG